jgi:hypothetical protein
MSDLINKPRVDSRWEKQKVFDLTGDPMPYSSTICKYCSCTNFCKDMADNVKECLRFKHKQTWYRDI